MTNTCKVGRNNNFHWINFSFGAAHWPYKHFNLNTCLDERKNDMCHNASACNPPKIWNFFYIQCWWTFDSVKLNFVMSNCNLQSQPFPTSCYINSKWSKVKCNQLKQLVNSEYEYMKWVNTVYSFECWILIRQYPKSRFAILRTYNRFIYLCIWSKR